MFSFCIRTTNVVIKPELVAKGIPMLGITSNIVEETRVELDPFKNSEKIKSMFFLPKLLYSFL